MAGAGSLASSIRACSFLSRPWGSTTPFSSPGAQCMCVLFWFCFLNDNIYNMASGSFVLSVGLVLGAGWGPDRYTHGQQRALVPHGRPPSLCEVGAHLNRFSLPRLLQSPPPSMAAWPSLLSVPVACCCLVTSVMSNSVRPYGLQPARVLCPWASLGKNTGVGCHALLQGIFPTQGLNLHLLNCR